MYHLCVLNDKGKLTITITTNVEYLINRFTAAGVTIKFLHQSEDFEEMREIWLGTYKDVSVTHPGTQMRLLVDGVVYTNVYEGILALDRIAPRVLGWRVRRFGDRLGVIGVRMLRRRQKRRERRRARKLARAARRVERGSRKSIVGCVCMLGLVLYLCLCVCAGWYVGVLVC